MAKIEVGKLNEQIAEIYGNRKKLEKSCSSLSLEDYLKIAINFLEWQDEWQEEIRSKFPCIKSFVFENGQIVLVVNGSIDEKKKREIQDSIITFTSFDEMIEKVGE